MMIREVEVIYKLDIEELQIEFVATGSGHQSISEAERLIRSIRENLGDFNVTKIDFTGLHLIQLLEKIFSNINKTPYFRRKDLKNAHTSHKKFKICPTNASLTIKF